ncbi:MAG TPA: nucleoid-associated protein, partial [Cyclobacteriaceae bacterium]|nr:nucleoid-associated protein [Cyclobacteriaceae bacterium]
DLTPEEESGLVKNIFLKPFQSAGATWEFRKDAAGSNTLHGIVKDLQHDGNLVIGSVNIGKHLKNVSTHPNIKQGDLFVIRFADILYNGNLCEAVGIYKVENKEVFVENGFAGSKAELKFRRGISGRKLDKGCLVLFTPEPYTVFTIDNVHTDTEYWKNDFLNIKLKQDPVNNTSKLLTLTKSFITESLPEQFEIEKADQIDLLNRSVNYFKNREEFTMQEFEDEVLQDKQVIDAFQSYDKGELLGINRGFEISQQAVKRQAKIFKSVLKLDKNFHVYIHGNRELIERGTEEDGRKFYKLYYKEEN